MYQNIIPYRAANWGYLCIALEDKHAVVKVQNRGDGMVWIEAKLPRGIYIFGYDVRYGTLYIETEVR